MKITSKSDYSLIIVIELAKLRKGGILPLSNIAKRYRLSLSYLEQLAAKLKKAKLINSKQGVKGGYFLARPASKIKVKDIIKAIGDSLSPVPCCNQESASCCDKEDTCTVKKSWSILEQKISDCLDSITLNQLIC